MLKLDQISFKKQQYGEFLDHYEIVKSLGKGSFGEVFECLNKISKIHRAVKYI